MTLAAWFGLVTAPVVAALLVILDYLGLDTVAALVANLGILQRVVLLMVAAWLALLSVALSTSLGKPGPK